MTQRGQSESVSRGKPSGGKVRSRCFSSGAGAHFGWRRALRETPVDGAGQPPEGVREPLEHPHTVRVAFFPDSPETSEAPDAHPPLQGF